MLMKALRVVKKLFAPNFPFNFAYINASKNALRPQIYEQINRKSSPSEATSEDLEDEIYNIVISIRKNGNSIHKCLCIDRLHHRTVVPTPSFQNSLGTHNKSAMQLIATCHVETCALK